MTLQLTLPDICGDPPAAFVECYSWDGAVWRLTDDSKVALAAMNADIAEAERASAAALEAAQQEHVKLKRQLDDRVISSGLRDALARHGVNPKIAAGAAAHFRTEYKPAATEDQRVVVMLNGGEVDLDHAVSTWLHSDIGCAFAQRTPVTATNKFTAALRRVTGG